MYGNDPTERPVGSHVTDEPGNPNRGGRLRLAVLAVTLAATVFAFGALVLPRAATDSSLERATPTDGASYAVVVDLGTYEGGRGCDRADEAAERRTRET